MKILDRFEIVGNHPALYDPEQKMLIISDLHLGLESLMAESGMFMPKFQLSEMKDDLSDMLAKKDIERLMVCGDIKHEFSETSHGERKEVEEFVDFLRGSVENIFLVKGNHDNYLIYTVKRYPNVSLKDEFVFDNVAFIHGHEKRKIIRALDVEHVIMGHEHPALTLTDEIGVKEKIRCLLYGEMGDGTKLIVMPSFSSLASGSNVNRISEDQILSPVLKEMIDLGEMKAIGVDKEAGLFKFPKLKEMRDAV
ncbi:MAG: metallophosphoesterase [Candidatus Thermoplasmatota archaeon]